MYAADMTATRHIFSPAHSSPGSGSPDATRTDRATAEATAAEVEDLSFLPDPTDWAPLASFGQSGADQDDLLQDDLLQDDDEPALPRWPSLPNRPVRGADFDEPRDPHDR